MGNQVVVLGNPVLDYTLEVERLPIEVGQHQEVRELLIGAGGTANALIGGARLGMPMQALGTLGDDAAGRQLLDWLHAEGIDTGAMVIAPGRRTTSVFVLVAPTADQSFLGFHPVADMGDRLNTAAAMPLPLDWVPVIRHAAALCCDGWAHGTLGPAMVLAAARQASAAGVPVFFDPGPRVGYFGAEWLVDLLRCVSSLSLTEDEARALVPGAVSIEGLARALRERGPHQVVIKRGALGCLVQRGTEVAVHPGFAVPVCDTTGAGDAVGAAIVLAWLRGYDVPKTAAFVNAAGAVAVQRLGGGLSMPRLAEIEAML